MQEIRTPLPIEVLTDLVGDGLREEASWTPRHRGSAWETAAVWLLVHTVARARNLQTSLPPDFAERFHAYTTLLWQQLREDDDSLSRPEDFIWCVNQQFRFSGKARDLLNRMESWLCGQHTQFKYHWLLRGKNLQVPAWFKPICG